MFVLQITEQMMPIISKRNIDSKLLEKIMKELKSPLTQLLKNFLENSKRIYSAIRETNGSH